MKSLFSHDEDTVGTRAALGLAVENGPDKKLAAEILALRGESATDPTAWVADRHAEVKSR